jgi:hypothetical protein
MVRKRKRNKLAEQAEDLAIQQAMCHKAQHSVLESYQVFDGLQRGTHPLSATEIKELARRRPSLWARFLAWSRA